MNQGGNMMFVFVLILVTVITIFMFVGIAPAVALMNEKIFVLGGQPLIERQNEINSTILDPVIVQSIEEGTQENAKDAFATNIEVLHFFYQYAWLFVIGITAIVLVLGSRFLVERQVGGAV